MTPDEIRQLREIANKAEDTIAEQSYPPMVEGRILHADADVFSYKACNLDESLLSNIEDLKIIINVWRRLAGAEYIYLHLTLGKKAGREEVAQLQQYQGKRTKDPDKAERVRDLREWMSTQCYGLVRGLPNHSLEADDTMCAAMHKSVKYDLNYVLYSPDKDLWMAPGLHINKDTYELEEFPNGYGKCYITINAKGEKKLKGKGTSWFWHQVLMGDQADNVPGLPFLKKKLWVQYAPTKTFLDLDKKIRSGRMSNGKVMTTAQKNQAYATYNKKYSEAKDKKIGPILAHKYLESCTTDAEAYQKCRTAYREWYGKTTAFINWRGIPVVKTYDEMLLEQARLLWIQTKPDEDVEEWMMKL